MKESQVEQHLLRRVKKLKGEVRKVQWVGRRHAPDRLVMLPPWSSNSPRIFLLELKRPGVAARRGQEREHYRLREFGWWVAVADSPEAVDEVLIKWTAPEERVNW